MSNGQVSNRNVSKHNIYLDLDHHSVIPTGLRYGTQNELISSKCHVIFLHNICVLVSFVMTPSWHSLPLLLGAFFPFPFRRLVIDPWQDARILWIGWFGEGDLRRATLLTLRAFWNCMIWWDEQMNSCGAWGIFRPQAQALYHGSP